MRTLFTLSATLVLVSLALLLNTTTGQTASTPAALPAPNTSNQPATATVSSGQATIRLMRSIVQVAAGGYHTCALTAAGGVQCWGYNSDGRLGDGATVHRNTPGKVIGLNSGVAAIATGASHACALTTTGGVKCWGYNGYGQLGDGTTTNRSTPVAVSGLNSGVVAITTAGNHTCALTMASIVYCWGYNGYGQLGDSTTTNRSTPVAVSDLSNNITAIAAGGAHTCALVTGNDLRCWGYNGYGQLGDGTTTNRSTPVVVSGLSNNITSITGGDYHNCALSTTGSVQCWGDNSNGQLGDGTSNNQSIPVVVSGLSNDITAIAGDGYHTCALTTTGAVYCWGYNYYGQLGDGTSDNQYTPVAVSNLSSGVTAIAGSYYHTCALTTAGSIKCWGGNEYGQLGDNTAINRNTPVPVSGLADGHIALHDAGDLVRWQTLTYTNPLPAGTPFTLTVRAGNTADSDDDGHWSDWATLGDSPADLTALPPARYLQVRATSTTELPTAFELGVLTWDSFTYTAKSGVLNTNTTWPAAGSPYIITGTLVVAQNRTLTLEPGAELWFRDQGRLQVRGGLVALGTPTQPITLTSWHVGKQPGDWRGVIFESTALSSTFNSAGVYSGGSVLQHTVIEAAGYGSRYAVDAPTTALLVDQSTIRANRAGGLRSHGGVVTHNMIAHNTLYVTTDTNGVGIANDGGGWIVGNTVIDNQATADSWSYRVYGGGIYSSGGGQVTDNVVQDNRIAGIDAAFGGGIYASGGVVARNTVQANVQEELAYGHGGGLAVDNAQVIANQVLSNTVDAYYYTYGGGIHATAGLLQNNMIAGNIALGRQSGGRGGGLYQIAGGTVADNQIYGNTIAAEGNSTWAAGGGIYATDGAAMLRNNIVSDNRANQAGGVYGNGANVTDNQLRNNHAVSNGGALWWAGDQTMSYNTLADNTSIGATGGIYIESGYPHLFANRVQDNTGYALYNNNSYVNINTTVNARGNWWGPIDADGIQTLLFDYNDDPDKGPVDVEEPAGPQMVDLRVSQSAAVIVPAVGHPFTYTVTVYNPSAGNASYVQLQERLPVTATVQQATPTHGSCTIDNGQARCALGTITGNLTVTVTLVVEPQAPGQLTHRVTVRSTEPDTDESNNQTARTDLIYVAPEHLLLNGPVAGLYGASYPFTATVQGDGERAAFIGVDNNTQGNWGGVYGRDGYVLPCWNYNNTLESRPAYIVNSTYSNLNCEGWNWNSSDPRALPGQADNSGQRNAAYGYNSTFFDIILEVNDDTIHDATFYIVDWISAYADIKQRIDLIDPTTGALLATSGMQTGFNNGRYLRFQFRGDVKVRFTPLSGWLAMVSGIFFDTDWTRQFDPTLPLTYTWQAVGQTPVVHVVNDHNPDHMEWLWQQWGRQPITLTASNIAGSVTTYHAIEVLTPPSSMSINGPAQALIGERYTYTATVAPITATTPITYIWEFSEGGQAENTGWQASYYTNTQRAGHPAVQRVESDLNFDWSGGSPDPAVPVDNFSARWTRTIYLANTGVYTFTTQCDDWMSVAVDGVTLRDGCGSITTTLQPGIHTIVVEFVENYGSASAHFTWERADGTTDPGRRAIVQPNGRNTPLQLRWAQPGSQIITVTAVTPLGNAVSTYTETVLVPPSQATIGGPTVGLYGASHPFTATVRGNSGRTTFIGVDNDTQGNWGGQYGHDGYVLPCWDYGNTLENRPAYIANMTYNNMNCSGWDWNSIGDQRALPAQADNGGRRSAALGYNNSFELMLDVSDNEPHDVAIYIVDWSNANIQQRIDLLNPATDAILATSGIQRDFFINGRYLRFQFRGDIKVRFTRLGDSHAVVSGIFFDTGLTPLPDPTLPLTYTWQATGQAPVVHVVNDNNPDQVEWLWRQWGRQPLTLTVSNIAGRATTYHAIDIITPPAGVSISGPGEILLAQPTAFTATVTPLTTTAPITYLWEFSPGGSLGDDVWQASYWNNTDRAGEPVLRRTEAAIDFDWGWDSSPDPGIPTDSFSARWSRQIYVATPGAYRFTTQCDDWMRVQVDAVVISDGCQNVEQYLATGLHTLTVEFIEYGGYARASFTYVRADGAPDFMNGSRVVQVGGLTNVITPTWAISGTHTITVTAYNGLDAVSSTHTILVRQPQTLLGAVRDGGDLVTWQHLPWRETLPADTPYTVYTRVGNSATPDTHWSAWVALDTPDAGNLTKLPPARYLQWQVKGAGTVDLSTYFQVGAPTTTPFAYTRAPQRITSNTTWTRANSPYLVTSQVLIGVGVRLTIEPGVTIRFSGPHVFLVEGTLVARGTITEPITFTSWHVQGQPGDWGFLVFEETAQDATFDNNQNYLSGSALQHVVVEYGGGRVVTAAKPSIPSYDYPSLGYAVDAVNTSLYVDHTAIRYNQAGGLRSKGGVITNNTIVSNTLTATRDIDGFGLATVGSGLLAYNLITDNQIAATNRNYTVRGIGLYAAAGSQVISNVIAYNSADNMNLLYGGGLYAGHGATVTDNQVRANTGTQINTIYGGGIYVEADSTVQHNTVQANRASAGTVYGGGLALGDGSRASNNGVQDNQVRAEGDSRGGGIYSRNATLQANVVIGNRQETTNYGQSYGGGIYSEAYDWWDAVQNRYRTGESLLVDNTVTDNQSSGRSAFGGAIYASGRFSITNNLLRANQVAYPNADDSNQAAYGGGIYAVGGQNGESCGAIVGSLHNNEIVSNQALGQRGYAGGAYLVNTTVQNSLIVNNSAGGNYGALWWKCDGAVTHTRIANNTSAGSTGGLYIEGRPVLNHNAIVDNSGYALNTISQANNPRLNARYNWWGTTDEASLDNLLYDFFDDPQRGFVNNIPYLQAAPTLSPTGGTVTGRTAGLVGAAYRFDVSVYPVAALKPMHFQWQTATAVLSHTVNALNDYATLTWETPGAKTITITATNTEGYTVITHTVTIATAGNSDAYESDDGCAQAQPITTDGTAQFHTIHIATDVDWVTFPATAGATYVIEATSPEDSNANMQLEVYSACAGSTVAGQDNSFGPDISFTLNAPANGPLYLRLIDESDAARRGLAASYHLSVRTLAQTPQPGLVILAAGKLKQNDAVQPNIYKVIEDAYQAFRANGYPAERIYYLAPDQNRDIDQDGVKDVDAISARGTLQSAITEWARTTLQPGQSLTLYLMDHGDQDVFYLNLLNNRLETVEPRELNEWLAEVEAAVPGMKINIIIEACRSGSFITASDLVQTISKPGRVVIASTGALPLAYASPNGGAMFSDVFIGALRRGLSLNSSFAEARWAVQESHPAQTPWLDDNGNGIPNESQDGQIAATRGFAYAGTFANVEWPPYIDAASFATDSGQIQTQVEVQGSGTIQRVWARIYPPSYVPPAEGEELVIETLPEVELYRQADSNVYQGNYIFGETGAYRVVIYATDSRNLLARPVDASDAIEAEPTATPTATPTPPTATATSEATATNTATPAATPTATPTATATPSPTPTQTPTATDSAAATPTPTMTVAVAASPTPTVPTPAGATATPTLTAIPNTVTPTTTPTATGSAEATPTATAAVAASPTPTIPTPTGATATFTPMATSTDTPAATDTVTPAATSPDTPTNTATPMATSTDTPTATDTITPAVTPTVTLTVTPTPTNPSTATPTATDADTPAATPTPTATSSATLTPLPTATSAPTTTPVAPTLSTATPTATSSATATATVTSIATVTPTNTVIPTPTGVVIVPTVVSTVTTNLGAIETALTFPPGAVAEAIVVVVAPAVTPPATGGFQLLGQVFTIDATTTDGSPVTQFDQPFTLVVTYTDAEVQGIDEQSLTLHYWHEGEERWVAIPTTVDAANNRLTATLDHLTTFAVLQGQASNPARLFLPLVQR